MNPFAAQIIAQKAQEMASAQPVSQISTPIGTVAQPYDFAQFMPQIQDALRQQEDRRRQAQSLAMQAASMQAPMMARPQLGRKEAGIAGGIAALGSILGARNAAPAFGRFMENRQRQLMEGAQADYERRATEAARQARIMAAQQSGLIQEAEGFGSLANALQGQAKLGLEAYNEAQDRAIKERDMQLKERKQRVDEIFGEAELNIKADDLVQRNKGVFTKMIDDLSPILGKDRAIEYAANAAELKVLMDRAALADQQEQTRLRPLIEARLQAQFEWNKQMGMQNFEWRQFTENRDFNLEQQQAAAQPSIQANKAVVNLIDREMQDKITRIDKMIESLSNPEFGEDVPAIQRMAAIAANQTKILGYRAHRNKLLQQRASLAAGGPIPEEYRYLAGGAASGGSFPELPRASAGDQISIFSPIR